LASFHQIPACAALAPPPSWAAPWPANTA
jgi:hypothetical protein